MALILRSVTSKFNRNRILFNNVTSFVKEFSLSSEAINSTSKQNEASATDLQPKIILSDTCKKRLNDICKDNKTFLRIIVDGGGCSGFQYKFDLDTEINKDDLIFGEHNAKVVVDSISLDYCNGATIDYHSELIRSGFRIMDNPKAQKGCSCGASFALKLD